MSYNPGDLVGIPFPYSDLKTEKRRPVIVHEDRHGDFVCAAVTSVSTPEFAVAITNVSVKGRIVSRSGDDYQLREQPAAYSAHFAPENALLSDDNTCFWSISDVI